MSNVNSAGYKIDKPDGTYITVPDSTVDQINTSLTLIGKNVVGYGEHVNENFVKLLQNFANNTPPDFPVAGQIWFDKNDNRIKVYDGEGFIAASGPIVTGIIPTPDQLVQGDLWIDSAENQLYFYDGVDLQLAGPVYKNSQGISGFTVETFTDTNNTSRTVVFLWVAEFLLGIFSKETTPFTPQNEISGFSGTIKPGFNPSTLSGLKFHVTAASADALVDGLGNLKTTANFMTTTGNTSATGTVSITNSIPLILGTAGSTEVRVSPTESAIINKVEDQDFRIQVKTDSVTNKDAIFVDTGTERVGIFNSTPAYTLDITGSLRATTGFMLPQYTTAARDAKSSSNGELIYNTDTNKVQAYASGSWVDLH